jgi:signal transduction histidine kinase
MLPVENALVVGRGSTVTTQFDVRRAGQDAPADVPGCASRPTPPTASGPYYRSVSERPRLSRASSYVQDALLAVLVTVMQVWGTIGRVHANPDTVVRPLAELGHLGYILLVVSGLAIAVRRRWPVAVFTITAAVSLTYYAVDYPDGPGWVSLFVAIYTVALYGDGRRSLMMASVGIAVLTCGWLASSVDLQPREAMGWVFFRIGASVMSAALGESIRSRRVIAEDAIERAELAERTRDEIARARVDEERLRIAREVHDTVAHAIAIINVQAGVTAHILDKHPERARDTLEVIAQASSNALEEMRSVLGVLRDEGEHRVPQQGLRDLDELLHSAREAGLDVTVDLRLGEGSVPTAVSSAAYRILQEALTNVIRHVGPGPVSVRIDRTATGLELRVADEGRGLPSERPPTAAAPGRGLVGMRERCRLLGGDFEAGAVPGGGFVVTARLPLASAEMVVR